MYNVQIHRIDWWVCVCVCVYTHVVGVELRVSYILSTLLLSSIPSPCADNAMPNKDLWQTCPHALEERCKGYHLPSFKALLCFLLFPSSSFNELNDCAICPS
jgi:hypothetical protein